MAKKTYSALLAVVAAASVAHPASGESVRIDVALPGVSRSFVKRWSIGDGALTAGLATDSSGAIYTTVASDVVALDASGSVFWTRACDPYGGCAAIARGPAALVAGTAPAGAVALAPATGDVLCTYQPGDLGASLAHLVTPGSSIVVGSASPSVVAIVDATTCTERYRIPSPNGERIGSVVADAASNTLVVAWDDAGTSSPVVTSYRLDTGAPRCSYAHEEMFRTLLRGGEHFGGWSVLRARDTGTCAAGASFAGNYGDVRDIAHDPLRDVIYLLGNHFSTWGLWVLDATTLAPLAHHADFFDNGLLSLNKMALGGRWVFVPDGGTLASGRIRVLDLELPSAAQIASFEHGRVTRLADRLIDGGLLLTQVQRGNVLAPDTPLVAFDVGDGDFVGRQNLLGSAAGNKHCEECLRELHYVELECASAVGGAWQCSLSHRYPHAVSGIVLAGLPDGGWYALGPSGTPLGATANGELPLELTLAPNATRLLRLARSPSAVPSVGGAGLAALAIALMALGLRAVTRPDRT